MRKINIIFDTGLFLFGLYALFFSPNFMGGLCFGAGLVGLMYDFQSWEEE